MPFHHSRIDLFIPEQVQHMVETGFALDGPDIDPYDPTAFVNFVHLPIRQSLWPTHYGTRDTARCAMARLGVTTAKHL